MRVKVFGAGSIGNHLSQASRRAGWDVVVVDPDKEALRRMREEIYPARYGAWDDAIEQYVLGEDPKGGFDVIFLGTPPHVRFAAARDALKEQPRILHLEKPLGTPDFAGIPEFLADLAGTKTVGVVGYEYTLAAFAARAKELLASGRFGAPQSMDVEIREHWGGIFGAHPWLKGPEDTYLGFWKRGGGAMSEHSHGINLWQDFARAMGVGSVREVSANLQIVRDGKAEYDQSSFLTLRTDGGFLGRVVQDVVTKPVRLFARVQCAGGFLECIKGATKDGDLIRWQVYADGDEVHEESFPKKRPDDFFLEIQHIGKLLDGSLDPAASPIALARGLDTMLVIAAGHRAHAEGRTVAIDPAKGHSLTALS